MLGLGRLGLDHLAADHWNSLVLVDEYEGTARLSIGDVVIFFGLPAGAAIAAGFSGAEMRSFGQLIEGTAILTGLLFGLLTHVLALGLRIADDPRLSRADRIVVLTDELRANVSYAIGVGIVLTGAMMLVSAFKPGFADTDPHGYPAWLSAIVLGLVLHLLLTLLMILKRVRSTYKQMGK